MDSSLRVQQPPSRNMTKSGYSIDDADDRNRIIDDVLVSVEASELTLPYLDNVPTGQRRRVIRQRLRAISDRTGIMCARMFTWMRLLRDEVEAEAGSRDPLTMNEQHPPAMGSAVASGSPVKIESSPSDEMLLQQGDPVLGGIHPPAAGPSGDILTTVNLSLRLQDLIL